MKKAISMLMFCFVLFSCGKKNEIETNSPSTEKIVPEDIAEDSGSSFEKVLSLNGISFTVSAKGNQLTLKPSGLSIDNSSIVRNIEGTVTNAEIGDLNSDSFPEVFVYSSSVNNGNHGKAYGFSVNNGKSVSDISIPNLVDDPKLSKGYMGHDEFSIVETILAQRFPLYKEEGGQQKTTGKMRQIQYKLREGEASRKLVVDQSTEF